MATIGYAKAIFRSGSQVWIAALLETLVVSVVSLIPLICVAVRQLLPPDSTIYLSDAFVKALLSGQLLFYALGFIATVVWQSNKDLNSFFPLRTLINLFSIMAIVVCSLVIGFDPNLSNINADFLATFSVSMFICSMILYTLMAIINQVHVNVGKDLAASDAELGYAVRRSRGLEND